MTGRELVDRAALSTAGHAYIRVREPQWANLHAYARFSVLTGAGLDQPRMLGPWMHLFDRHTQEVIGEPTPQALCLLLQPGGSRGFLEANWIVYDGPIDPADQGSGPAHPESPR